MLWRQKKATFVVAVFGAARASPCETVVRSTTLEVVDTGPASASAAIDVSDVGSAADSVLLGARVQGDFLTGHANVSALGTTLRCSPRRSQCATYDDCSLTRPLPYANETTILVTLATSPAVDFDFCPLGVYARAHVDVLFALDCPSPSPTTALQPSSTAPILGGKSSSSSRRRRRFAHIVGAAIVVASGAMALFTAVAFAWVRVLQRNRR